MTRKESIELFNKGYQDWNAWAEQMLAKKEELMKSGVWSEGDQNKRNEETRAWQEEAKADFSGYGFGANVKFVGFCFPGDAVFNGATFAERMDFGNAEFFGLAKFFKVTFMKDVSFSSTKFFCGASFEQAKFKDRADFYSTNFEGNTSFWLTTFSDMVLFRDAIFSGDADFLNTVFRHIAIFSNVTFSSNAAFFQCVFESATSFKESSFEKKAYFRAIIVKGAFSIDNVRFDRVPDFSEAHFEEAPLFDNVDLEPEHFSKITTDKSDNNLPACWRALKRLANQGLDHERELQFFKGEILARRGTLDRCTHLRFWVGWLYQAMSDFGRSTTRPLLWLVASFLLFTGFYISQSKNSFQLLFAESATCVVGSDNPKAAALSLSVYNAVPFAANGWSNRLKQVYACLYGVQDEIPLVKKVYSPTGLTPVIPYGVAFAGVIQFFVSAVLIFLFVLAIRNHFRIR